MAGKSKSPDATVDMRMEGLAIREMVEGDASRIAEACAAVGWSRHKPLSQFQRYFAEQEAGDRVLLLAEVDGTFAGYLNVVWHPSYESFADQGIPEVQDFNVLPPWRRQKVGTALMDRAEKLVATRSKIVGIGVGMYADYGNAQRLYVKRGYVPDGRGLTYAGRVLAPLETATNDDDLVLYFTKCLDST